MINLNPITAYQSLLKNPKTKWITVIITLIYIFSPIDIIPELIIPPFGLIDDTAILGLLITTLMFGDKKENVTYEKIPDKK